MFRCGSGGSGDSAFSAGRISPTQEKVLAAQKRLFGTSALATQPKPPGLVFYELRPAKGHLEIVSS